MLARLLEARLARLQELLPKLFAIHERAINFMREEIEKNRLKYRIQGKPLTQIPPEAFVAAAEHFSAAERRTEFLEIVEPIENELTDFDGAEKARLRELREQLDTIGSVNTSLVVGGTSLTYIALLVACLFILRDIAERRRHLAEFASTMRAHVRWEEETLFPSAESILTDRELDALGEDLEARLPETPLPF